MNIDKMILEKGLPYDEFTEKSVIGSILIDFSKLDEILDIIEPSDFYNQINQDIFQNLIELRIQNQSYDKDLIIPELRKRIKTLSVKTILSYEQASIIPSNAVYYAKTLKELSQRRKFISDASLIASMSYEDPIEEIELRMREMSQNRAMGKKPFYHLSEICNECSQYLDNIDKNKSQSIGLLSGFYDVDEITCGMQKQDLIVIAARPSMGKTSLACCIAQNIAQKNGLVFIETIETSRLHLLLRMCIQKSSIDSQKIYSGKIDNNEWSKLIYVLGELSKLDICIDDSGKPSTFDIKIKAERLMRMKNRKLSIIIIDYLQLMKSSQKITRDSRHIELNSIMQELKGMAKELDCPVIVLSQLNRSLENRPDRRPRLSDLRESGGIEETADVVQFIYRDEFYNIDSEDKGIAEILIKKNRNGRTGATKLTFLNHCVRFENRAKF